MTALAFRAGIRELLLRGGASAQVAHVESWLLFIDFVKASPEKQRAASEELQRDLVENQP